MLISYLTHPAGLETSTGFGYAGFNIVTSLQNLGHRVVLDSPESPIQFMFTQPQDYSWHENQYSIGYTPWESTALQTDWQEEMASVSELWCTSELNKQWFEDLGLSPTKVYPHGITHNWTPRHRKPKKKLRFLHVGEPAPRKGGQMAFDAFRNVFGDDEDITLTIKANQGSNIRYDPKTAGVLRQPQYFSNVELITKNLPESELVALFHNHDVLLYPSWGEGFGFIPLQALATGMPVIFNSSWAPYKKYSMGLDVDDRLVPSPWTTMHPGKMLEPSQASLERLMVEVSENYGYYSQRAFQQADHLHREYDWDRQTYKAFQPLIERFSKD